MSVFKSLREYYPFPSFRSGGELICDKIEKAVLKNKKFIILHGETGAGKTGYAVAYARKYGSPILTATKVLQDQYTSTKEFNLETTLKGKANYTCGLDPLALLPVNEASCMSDTITFQERKTLPFPELHTDSFKREGSSKALKVLCASHGICEYYSKVYNINSISGIITNYDFYLLKKLNRNPMSAPLSSYLVCDEAHHLISKLQDYYSINLNYDKLLYTLGESAIRAPNESVRIWMSRMRSDCSAKLFKETNAEHVTAYSRLEKKLATTLKLDIEDKNKFFEESTDDEVNIKVLDLTPYKEDIFADLKSVLFTSATFPPDFLRTLGIDESEIEYINIPSTTPIKNRPAVYCKDIENINYKTNLTTASPAIKMLEAILVKHSGQKGVIHTSSYKYSQMLYDIYRKDKRFRFVEKGDNKTTVIEEHAKKVGAHILVSPSLTEGVDLKDDLARFQILLKVPYPMLNDYSKRMMEINPGWYESTTITNIVQAYGRAIRHEDDSANFYILDGSFNMLHNKNSAIIPKYLKDALISGKYEKLISYLKESTKS